jgi:hypothetical protein
VGIDGGYVRDWDAKKHNFEVIVGKSTLAFTRDEDEETPSSKRFGFVQTCDPKPKRRLYEVLQSQGFQLNQQITFLSDGGDAVRDLQLYMSPGNRSRGRKPGLASVNIFDVCSAHEANPSTATRPLGAHPARSAGVYLGARSPCGSPGSDRQRLDGTSATEFPHVVASAIE